MFKQCQSHNLTHEDRGNHGPYPHRMDKKMYCSERSKYNNKKGDSFRILLKKNKTGEFC